MTLNEMADLLSGLATTLEKVMKQSGAKDLQTISECFRKFGDDNVGSFCNYIIQAKEGKPSAVKKNSAKNGEKVSQLVLKIQHFLDHQDEYDYSALRQIAADIGGLKNHEIEEIGKLIRCPVSGKKADMVRRIEDWLTGIKLSADQASFSMSGTGT